MAKKSQIKPNYIPFIKWVGGKRAIAAEILTKAKIDATKPLEAYIEPFLGGGAMFFHLKNIGLIGPDTKVTLSDMNKSLIITYIVIRDKCKKLIKKLKEHQKKSQWVILGRY